MSTSPTNYKPGHGTPSEAAPCKSFSNIWRNSNCGTTSPPASWPTPSNTPKQRPSRIKPQVAQRLRDAAATAHSTVDKILDSAIRTVADMQLTADREQHLAETRRDLADAIVSRVLDKSHRAAASTGPEAAWQDALEELLPADLAAERAIAIAATRSAAVDRRVTARSQHPDIEKLLAKPEHPADAGSPPDLGG